MKPGALIIIGKKVGYLERAIETGWGGGRKLPKQITKER
jgi:hypothetical protein